jgi:capsular exopolysaccharide synthesis family protein
MELRKIWGVIRRRKWIIIQCILVIVLTAFLGSHLITPSYQASSKILMKKAKKGAEAGGRELHGLPGLSSMIIRTHADVDVNKVLATSRGYIEEMISNLQIRDKNGELSRPENLTSTGLALTLKRRIFPEPTIGISKFEFTDILQLSAKSTDAREAMMMATTLAEIMVKENQGAIRGEYAMARDFLESQMKIVKIRYIQELQAVTEFQKKEKTIDLKLETKQMSQKMMELLKQKEDDVIELAETKAKERHLRKQLALQNSDYLFADTLQDSPQIAALKKREGALQLELTQAMSEFTDRHPRVQALKEQIRLAEEELTKEIKVYRSSAPQLIALGRQLAALETRLEKLDEDIERYLKTLGGLPDKVFRHESMGMELNVTQQNYKSLLDSLYQLRMGEATTLSEISVIEKAQLPLQPASPKKVFNGILGAMVGLIMGLGLAFLVEYLDDTIRTSRDVMGLRPVELIGTVPKMDWEKMPLIQTRDPNDPFYESYRKIRNQLKVHERPIGALLISSAGPKEGRSTTALNLGISFAREGKKVVVVDTDLRRPSLHAFFDMPNDVGMSDLLQGMIPLKEAIMETRYEDLSIIPSGSPYPDPGGLIESDEMSRLISELKNRFDTVILDSAPLLVKSDGLVLAKYVDGSIIVLESQKTTLGAVRGVMDLLAKIQIKPLGFVLNRFSIEKGKHFYQYYYSHYGGEMSADEAAG